MSAERPLSVIIPVYNGEGTITRCLDSLIAISEADRSLEIIIINDGSSDSTLEVIWHYKSLHPTLSIQVVSQDNQGQSVARNKGLDLATGEYVWFVDADDWVDSETADYLLSLVAKESYDMLCFGVRNRGEERKEASSEWLDPSTLDFETLKETDGRTLLTQYDLPGSVWSFLWRRSLLESYKARFMVGLLHEDALFYWHYTAYAERILLVPRVGYYYYQRAGSSIHNSDTLHLRGVSRIEGSFRLLMCAKEIESLESFYISKASYSYRAGLRMVARYGKVSELKEYTLRMEQEEDYKCLMNYAGCKGAFLIYLAHKVPYLFNLIIHILPPVT